MSEMVVNFERIVQLVELYGQDSLAYLTLETGKKYFLDKQQQGFIAYVVVNKIALCLGNPVCKPEIWEALLQEFRLFCQQKQWKICYCSVSEEALPFLKKEGYISAKYGEEAILELDSYHTGGSKRLKLRQKIKRAAKLGMETIEYYPQKERDFVLEKKILQVSEQWYSDKKGKLTFTLGEIDFNCTLSRRYFVALNEEKEVQAILVFCPFAGKKGYFLDVMRRKKEAVAGVMEKSIIDAAIKMKEEGVTYVSLGIAPLAGISNKGSMNALEKYLNFTYQHLNYSYGFKTLYDYKRKFDPSLWLSRYVVYDRRLSCLHVGFAMVKAKKTDHFWSEVSRDVWQAGRYSLQSATKRLVFKYRKRFLFQTNGSREKKQQNQE